eukprot:TRINITY_DN2656_c0_g1_i2.p1 TRINITY_DN2656_c0_g1~~TRINITY_DN2656_c0_g1_i2.p1  ORF type:complete len:718 (+),score=240.38 TRINITY_DN2656_c0_g1_i2:1908-4061(+)
MTHVDFGPPPKNYVAGSARGIVIQNYSGFGLKDQRNIDVEPEMKLPPNEFSNNWDDVFTNVENSSKSRKNRKSRKKTKIKTEDVFIKNAFKDVTEDLKYITDKELSLIPSIGDMNRKYEDNRKKDILTHAPDQFILDTKHKNDYLPVIQANDRQQKFSQEISNNVDLTQTKTDFSPQNEPKDKNDERIFVDYEYLENSLYEAVDLDSSNEYNYLKLLEILIKQGKFRKFKEIAFNCIAAYPNMLEVWNLIIDNLDVSEYFEKFSKNLKNNVFTVDICLNFCSHLPVSRKSAFLELVLQNDVFKRSTRLWDHLLTLSNSLEEQKVILAKSVQNDACFDNISYWIRLAKSIPLEQAKQLLNVARHQNPHSFEIWIAAFQLEELFTGSFEKLVELMTSCDEIIDFESMDVVQKIQYIEACEGFELTQRLLIQKLNVDFDTYFESLAKGNSFQTFKNVLKYGEKSFEDKINHLIPIFQRFSIEERIELFKLIPENKRNLENIKFYCIWLSEAGNLLELKKILKDLMFLDIFYAEMYSTYFEDYSLDEFIEKFPKCEKFWIKKLQSLQNFDKTFEKLMDEAIRKAEPNDHLIIWKTQLMLTSTKRNRQQSLKKVISLLNSKAKINRSSLLYEELIKIYVELENSDNSPVIEQIIVEALNEVENCENIHVLAIELADEYQLKNAIQRALKQYSESLKIREAIENSQFSIKSGTKKNYFDEMET